MDVMVFVLILAVGVLAKFLGWLMSWQAKKYRGYAIECVRLAKQAESIEKRNKLLACACMATRRLSSGCYRG